MNKMIQKYGQFVRLDGRQSVCRTVCQGCGEVIMSDTTEEIGYSISKRGEANFWHKACEGDVWMSKVRWVS